jgi:hypothetical protein
MRGLTSSKSATIIFMSYEGRTVYSSEIKYDIKIIRWEIFSGWNEVEEIRIFYALE